MSSSNGRPAGYEQLRNAEMARLRVVRGVLTDMWNAAERVRPAQSWDEAAFLGGRVAAAADGTHTASRDLSMVEARLCPLSGRSADLNWPGRGAAKQVGLDQDWGLAR